VPENIVIEKMGEAGILEDAADILLKEHFPKIIDQEKFDILGRPNISVTKLALNNPFEFKATFAVLPEFELPDYKKIAASVTKPASAKASAGEEEVDEVLLQIRKNKAHFDHHQKNPDDKDHSHSGLDLEKEENLPPLDDKLAKSAGNFKNLEELKEKIKENIAEEKKFREIEKRRAQIMEELIKNVKIDLPDILVKSESEKAIAQLKNDIERMKGKWEEYLTHTKKTEDDLRNDLKESSEKKAKIQLIFNKIAEKEKIEPNKEVLDQEVRHLMEHYKDAKEESARVYVATILINQEILKLLENIK
jgi:FKBP-type peptidyl-prolyl cis-trans isomerase (trigger factor)